MTAHRILLPDHEKSLWHGLDDQARYPRLDSDMSCDAVIIGGGISGLTAAYLLKQSGLKVIVLEKNHLASGSTGKTTGKVTSQHNLIYHKLHSRLGQNVAQLYAQSNQDALTKIRAIVTKEGIDCDWQDDDNYVYTTDAAQVGAFRKEAQIAINLGLPASFETTSPLPFAVTAAVKFTGQAKFNGRKYVLGLAEAVDGDGSAVYENTRAIGIHDGRPGKVRTARGTVTAKHIIVATKVPTTPLVARGCYALMEYPLFSYLVAGKLKQDFSGMYISPDSGHYSILPFTANGSRYLMVGGEGHVPGTRFDFKARHQRLADYAQQHFGLEVIDYRWKAWDYLAYDDIPLAGKVYPWSRNLYTSTGYMKWGLTNSMVCAQILHDQIIGRPNPGIHAFSTLRSGAIKSIPKAMGEIAKKVL